MSKRVLIISSSPRKGENSDTLCDMFLNGATEAGHSVEKIFLKDKTINDCIGCGSCSNNGHLGCIQKDDMNDISKMMIKSDVILLATPVYFYSMCGQMKIFINRCCSVYTKIAHKEFYFIISSADERKEALQRTLDDYRVFLSSLESPIERDVIFATGAWQTGEIEKSHYVDIAYKMGKAV